MNNFKKLLASAMALSMVTSVLPTMGVSAATTCVISERNAVNELTEAIVQDLKNAGKKLTNVAWNLPITWTNADNGSERNLYELMGEHTDEFKTVIDNKCAVSDDVKYLAGFVEKVGLLGTIDNTFKGSLFEKIVDEGVITTKDWNDGIKDLYDKVLTAEGYIGNGVFATTSEKNTFVDNVATLKELVADYQSAYVEIYAKQFVKDLLGEDNETVAGQALKADKFARTNLTALEDAIADAKEDSLYELVQDEDEVVEVMDALEDVVEDIKAVNELLDRKSDANKAYKEVKGLVASLAAAQITDEDANNYLFDVIATFKSEDIENVTTYVEDLFNEFYTVKTRKRSNGKYTVELEATDYVRYLTDEDIKTVKGGVDTPVEAILTTLSNETAKTPDTYYDELLAADVVTKEDLLETAYAAEDVELKFTYTTDEVDAVYDAKDAVDTLLAGDYGLTAKERRALKSLQTNYARIITRIEKSDVVIIESKKDWWIFENGQWVFYKDGKTVGNHWVADINNDWYHTDANGVMQTNTWVASTKDIFYYVGEDGKMVTNTVVDGYVIDANGQWHR